MAIRRCYTNYIIIAVFREHINYIILSNRVKPGLITSNENNRKKEPPPLQVATESTREFVTSVSLFGGVGGNSGGVGGGS